jgi:Asp/Glu/hydantoin racemase
MSVPSERIALIHATPLAVSPVLEAFGRLWPAAQVYNLLDDSLAPDLERAGGLDDALIGRIRRLAAYAADSGAAGILFTCSAFGLAIEVAARDLAPLPVLKPNQAMFAEALTAGTRIGMVATFAPSVPSMEREFRAMALDAGDETNLTTVCVPKAMEALRDGDDRTHNRLVAEAASGLNGCDAILLAHFSTAQAREAVAKMTTVPILTSPESAVRKLRQQ